MSAVFLSYAREDRTVAEKVANALIAKNHTVFWDRNIKTGEVWDEVLARELHAADYVVVLWSKHSAASRWVRAEASEAAERGILLPAVIDKRVRIPFQFKLIQAVDLADWDEDPDAPAMQSLVAGIEHQQDQPRPQTGSFRPLSNWRKVASWSVVLLGVLLVSAAILQTVAKRKGWRSLSGPNHTLLRSAEGDAAAANPDAASRAVVNGPGSPGTGSSGSAAPSAETLAIVTGIESQAKAGNYAQAWKTLQTVSAEERALEPLRRLEISLAQDWLRNGRGDAKETVNEVTPTLLRASGSTNREIAADAKAHIGYANFLETRMGASGLAVDKLYKEGLDLDPTNVYAHTLWAHWIVWNNGSLGEAARHIEAALKAGKERPFVRRFQLAMLLKRGDLDMEILRVLNEMRRNNETLEPDSRHSLESHLYYPFKEETFNSLPADLSAEDHLATYLWLTAELEPLLRRRFVVACLTEQAGLRSQALKLYRELTKETDFELFTSKDQVQKGIARCQAGIGVRPEENR